MREKIIVELIMVNVNCIKKKCLNHMDDFPSALKRNNYNTTRVHSHPYNYPAGAIVLLQPNVRSLVDGPEGINSQARRLMQLETLRAPSPLWQNAARETRALNPRPEPAFSMPHKRNKSASRHNN